MTDAPSWVSPVLTLLISLVLPYLIQYVAVSSRKWLNAIIAFGSAAVLGVLTAWTDGQFGADMWLNVTIAITAMHTAYKGYWEGRLEMKQPQGPR